ncbi:hypothetical protein QA601_11165 [Chitinispirillales bacterium ANBcel5]|uniref:diacylglycerol/polyprenol kinase family protein n=1 Tax=Cellulosispirillum alkaliphilum TaxID=3039283 RepID=UPI002A595A06|nr:hypothetical protein [Chitinispirillales bacterium ANBcel5]
MGLRKEEITRKILHLFALLMPIAIFYTPRMNVSFLLPLGVLAFLLFGSIIVEWLRFRYPLVQKVFFTCFGKLLRKEEKSKTTGSTFVIAASLLCAILFRNNLHIAFIVLFLFILGDAIAAIVGLSIGRVKIGKKSLEGSIACFLLCMALLYWVIPLFPGVFEPWGNRFPLILALITSLSITLLELFPLKINKKHIINDNLAVPVITGYVILFMDKVFIS